MMSALLRAADSASATIDLARRRRTEYDSTVPEKKGNRRGNLNCTRRTNGAMPFFYVCDYHRVSSMGSGGGEAFGLAGYLVRQFPTLPFAALPLGKGSGGLTTVQGGSHA
jgi:hypothetical protein